MASRTHVDVGAYYDQELAGMAEATGAGLIWFMGRDHLSPPLSNEDQFALNASQWRQASSERVLDLAHRMGMKSDHVVVELGCGIGGPGRDITEATGSLVLGLSVSVAQLRNLRTISSDIASAYTNVIGGDMQQIPLANESVDHVYSINAIYHVNDPVAVIDESYRILTSGGKFGVDDWFTTDKTSDVEINNLRKNWSTGSNGFHNITAFIARMQAQGFNILEVIDHTEQAGGFLSEERFGVTYDTQVAPLLLDVFPKLYKYEGYEDAHAQMAVDQLRSDILYMGELYRSGSAVYQQIIGQK